MIHESARQGQPQELFREYEVQDRTGWEFWDHLNSGPLSFRESKKALRLKKFLTSKKVLRADGKPYRELSPD